MDNKKYINIFFSLILFLFFLNISVMGAAGITDYVREIDYVNYLEKYSLMPRPDKEIFILASDYQQASSDVQILKGYAGYDNKIIKTGEKGFVEWEVYVEKEGLYNIGIKYYPVKGRGSDIERELFINDRRPFAGAKYLTFKRIWGDKGKIRKDSLGNEIRPQQIEKPMWIEKSLEDSLGYIETPYLFYFKAGKNTIKLISRSEPMVVAWLKLHQAAEVKSYKSVFDSYPDKDVQNTKGVFVKLQGREAAYRSDSSLFPIFEKGDPTVEPYHSAQIRLNAIGGYRWSRAGQWIIWEFEVPEDGLYKIGLKAKQDVSRGTFSNRRIMIDNVVPFEELSSVPFPYSSEYKMRVLGKGETGEAYYFYLTRGKHQLKMEVVLGELNDVLRRIENSLYELNTIYRRIIMITSSTPDPMRSYQIEVRVPDIIDKIQIQQKELEDIADWLEEKTNQKGGHLVVLNNFARLLSNMVKDPEIIPGVLGEYRDNIGSLGSWIMDTRDQPLQIDYLVLASPEQKMPRAEATVLETIKHEYDSFLASFTHEYNKVGSLSKEAEEQILGADSNVLRVWIGSGRDQAQILKRLIEDDFTPQTGIPVQLELVPKMNQILVKASISNTGPDVALGVMPQDPMNFAMRGAVIDLSRFDDFREVKNRFMKSAFLSYSFRNAVYALPEKQSFPMLFYRKDILAEMGLPVPDTWEDVYEILPELQKNNMQFGLGSGVGGSGTGTFLTFLYQKGGHFYKVDGIRTDLDSELAIETFNEMTDLWTLYSFPFEFNVENRFRMGEMPLVVSNYGLYNTLKVFAPELRGEWDFTLIPGTIQKDGTINRTVASSGKEASLKLAAISGTQGGTTGPADVIMSTAGEMEDEAWEFLKWWTSTEIQVKFGRELESLLGAAARYPTANIEAMKQLPWTLEEREKLLKQWQYVEGVREVPGSYYATRLFDWAFRAVAINFEPVRETLMDYDLQINEEIKTKRSEFGLTNDMNNLKKDWKEDFWNHFSQVKSGDGE